MVIVETIACLRMDMADRFIPEYTNELFRMNILVTVVMTPCFPVGFFFFTNDSDELVPSSLG